jgi:hypothetical protein
MKYAAAAPCSRKNIFRKESLSKQDAAEMTRSGSSGWSDNEQTLNRNPAPYFSPFFAPFSAPFSALNSVPFSAPSLCRFSHHISCGFHAIFRAVFRTVFNTIFPLYIHYLNMHRLTATS